MARGVAAGHRNHARTLHAADVRCHARYRQLEKHRRCSWLLCEKLAGSDRPASVPIRRIALAVAIFNVDLSAISPVAAALTP
ncbi:hypothetical protein D3C71_1944980 [compost metagenome]